MSPIKIKANIRNCFYFFFFLHIVPHTSKTIVNYYCAQNERYTLNPIPGLLPIHHPLRPAFNNNSNTPPMQNSKYSSESRSLNMLGHAGSLSVFLTSFKPKQTQRTSLYKWWRGRTGKREREKRTIGRLLNYFVSKELSVETRVRRRCSTWQTFVQQCTPWQAVANCTVAFSFQNKNPPSFRWEPPTATAVVVLICVYLSFPSPPPLLIGPVRPSAPLYAVCVRHHYVIMKMIPVFKLWR